MHSLLPGSNLGSISVKNESITRTLYLYTLFGQAISELSHDISRLVFCLSIHRLKTCKDKRHQRQNYDPIDNFFVVHCYQGQFVHCPTV
jgi:hypothetical protein